MPWKVRSPRSNGSPLRRDIVAPVPPRTSMSRLRIAHIILSRGFAGSERATVEMCNAHCEKHDVLLIIRKGHANKAGITIRQYVDPRVKVVEVGNWFPRAG